MRVSSPLVARVGRIVQYLVRPVWKSLHSAACGIFYEKLHTQSAGIWFMYTQLQVTIGGIGRETQTVSYLLELPHSAFTLTNDLRLCCEEDYGSFVADQMTCDELIDCTHLPS